MRLLMRHHVIVLQLGFAALISCCGGAVGPGYSDYSVHGEWNLAIDPAFTEDELANIRAAADMWNSFAGTHIRLDQANGLACPPCIVRQHPGGNVVGLTYADGRILLRPGLDFGLAAHELGHLIGLQHVKYGIMQPVGAQDTLSKYDIAECFRCGACKW